MLSKSIGNRICLQIRTEFGLIKEGKRETFGSLGEGGGDKKANFGVLVQLIDRTATLIIQRKGVLDLTSIAPEVGEVKLIFIFAGQAD